MMKEPTENHLKNKYVGSIIKSPLLITAPHTKQLQRGGKQYHQESRIHKRQIYTSFLACDLAICTGNNSFLFWGVSSIISETDLDPNYLMPQQLKTSPFHQALHHWALLSEGLPLLHVDLHGKMDRQHNCQIDVGIRSMQVHWDGDPLIQKIKVFFKKHGNIFGNLKFNGFECSFNTSPFLDGFWGGDLHTMTEQAILLGIPSLQLEIPFSVRKKLLRDNQLRKRFQDLIHLLYTSVIVPDSQQAKRKLWVVEQLGKAFVPSKTIKGQKERQEVYEQVLRFQTKEEANPGQKRNI